MTLEDPRVLFLLIPAFALMAFYFYRSVNNYADRRSERKLSKRSVIMAFALMVFLICVAVFSM